MAQFTFATLRNNDFSDTNCYSNKISFTSISTRELDILKERVWETTHVHKLIQ